MSVSRPNLKIMLTGDQERARRLVPLAISQLDLLRAAMEFNSIDIDRKRLTLCSEWIDIEICHGLDYIKIYSPPVKRGQRPDVEYEVATVLYFGVSVHDHDPAEPDEFILLWDAILGKPVDIPGVIYPAALSKFPTEWQESIRARRTPGNDLYEFDPNRTFEVPYLNADRIGDKFFHNFSGWYPHTELYYTYMYSGSPWDHDCEDHDPYARCPLTSGSGETFSVLYFNSFGDFDFRQSGSCHNSVGCGYTLYDDGGGTYHIEFDYVTDLQYNWSIWINRVLTVRPEFERFAGQQGCIRTPFYREISCSIQGAEDPLPGGANDKRRYELWLSTPIGETRLITGIGDGGEDFLNANILKIEYFTGDPYGWRLNYIGQQPRCSVCWDDELYRKNGANETWVEHNTQFAAYSGNVMAQVYAANIIIVNADFDLEIRGGTGYHTTWEGYYYTSQTQESLYRVFSSIAACNMYGDSVFVHSPLEQTADAALQDELYRCFFAAVDALEAQGRNDMEHELQTNIWFVKHYAERQIVNAK